ncbi:hypothetical protein BASA81_014026 [Batrachochytrium salamandrivorans]|nr:hypothetical protein BASA81_014026 [Batrachochytrium salamandrivorans]
MNGQEAAQLALARKRKGEAPVEKTETVSMAVEDDSSFHTVTPNQLLTFAGVFVFLVLLAHTVQKLVG